MLSLSSTFVSNESAYIPSKRVLRMNELDQRLHTERNDKEKEMFITLIGSKHTE